MSQAGDLEVDRVASSSSGVENDEPNVNAATTEQPSDAVAGQFVSIADVPLTDYYRPPVISILPPASKQTRITNRLKFIQKNLLKSLKAHKYCWPFNEPVNAVQLKLPYYYKVIEKPMDFGTITKRLLNKFYSSSEECISDIQQVFVNCYKFNVPGSDVHQMGLQVEEVFRRKKSELDELFPEEEVLEKEEKKKRPKSSSSFSSVIRSPPQSALFEAPSTDSIPKAESLDVNDDALLQRTSDTKAASPCEPNVDVCDVEALSPRREIANDDEGLRVDIGERRLEHTNAVDYSQKSDEGQDTPINVESISPTAPNEGVDGGEEGSKVDEQESEDALIDEQISPPLPAASSMSFNTAESLHPPSSSSIVTDPPQSISSRRGSSRPIKKPKRDLPTTIHVNRKRSHRSQEQFKVMKNIINELSMNKKRVQEYSWPFLEPVNSDNLEAPNYSDLIRRPMDLSTIRRNLENNEYLTVKEAADDVRQIFFNCFKFNPPDHYVSECGHKCQQAFEMLYATQMPGTVDVTVCSGHYDHERSACGGRAAQPQQHASPPLPPHQQQLQQPPPVQQATPVQQAIAISSQQSEMHLLSQQVTSLQKIVADLKKTKGKSADSTTTAATTTKAVKASNSRRKTGDAAAVGGSASKRSKKPATTTTETPKSPQPQQPPLPTVNAAEPPEAALFPKLSFEEKKSLKKDLTEIQKKNEDSIVEVVNIVKDNEKKQLGGSDDGEIELDFEKLSSKTLRMLQKFAAREKEFLQKKKGTSSNDVGASATSTSTAAASSKPQPKKAKIEPHHQKPTATKKSPNDVIKSVSRPSNGNQASATELKPEVKKPPPTIGLPAGLLEPVPPPPVAVAPSPKPTTTMNGASSEEIIRNKSSWSDIANKAPTKIPETGRLMANRTYQEMKERGGFGGGSLSPPVASPVPSPAQPSPAQPSPHSSGGGSASNDSYNEATAATEMERQRRRERERRMRQANANRVNLDEQDDLMNDF